MALDESISDEDVTEDVAGIKFIFSKHVAHLMEGIKIDYTKSWFGKQLTIQSPFAGAC